MGIVERRYRYKANVTQKNIRDGSKIEFTRTYFDRARARIPRLPRSRRDVSRKLQLTLCVIMVS